VQTTGHLRDGQATGCPGSQADELTKEELAAYFRVTKRTLTTWMRQKGLPFVKISRRTVRFKASAIKEWEASFSSNGQIPQRR